MDQERFAVLLRLLDPREPVELLFFVEGLLPVLDFFDPLDRLPPEVFFPVVERDDEVLLDVPRPADEPLPLFDDEDLPPVLPDEDPLPALLPELDFPPPVFPAVDFALDLFAEEGDFFEPPDDADDFLAPPEVDLPRPLDEPERLDELRELPVEVMVSAAAPTAPTAAPVAAPVRISPATSMTLFTIAVVVDFLDLDELPFEDEELLLFELRDFVFFAII